MSVASSRTTARTRVLALVSAVVLTSAITTSVVHAQREQDNAFTWSGTIGSGKRALVKNINGSIHVERSTSGKVEITAMKQWRRGNPEDVRIEQKMTVNGDVVVCALWTDDARCDENGIHTEGRHRNWSDRNDVSVRFTVRVPDGVRVDLTTVNGALEVNGVSNEVRAATVNGSINAVSAGGPVRATTVNGSIHISMGSLGSAEDLEYETTNGSVTVELPANFGAQLDMSTVNGRVSTDFPITVSGTLSPKHLRGTVGNGATRMRISTVNGSITLRKRE